MLRGIRRIILDKWLAQDALKKTNDIHARIRMQDTIRKCDTILEGKDEELLESDSNIELDCSSLWRWDNLSSEELRAMRENYDTACDKNPTRRTIRELINNPQINHSTRNKTRNKTRVADCIEQSGVETYCHSESNHFSTGSHVKCS